MASVKSQKLKINYFRIVVCIVFVILAFVANERYGSSSLECESEFEKQESSAMRFQHKKNAKSLKYWGSCLNNWHKKGNLFAMNNVFNRLGYETVNGLENEDWDFLWTIEYPFLPENLETRHLYDKVVKPLESHQKINHVPGMNYVTNKSWMSTHNRNIGAILQGFLFPSDLESFQEFVKENPDARFVVKNKDNLGVKLVNISDINYGESEVFYQHFMERPLLIDDRAMDFSVYFLVSSINPLKIYRFTNDILLRFCKDPYYPFDSEITSKYVISDIRVVPVDMPSLSYNIRQDFSVLNSIAKVFHQKGFNIEDLWPKIDKAAVNLILQNEHHMVDTVSWMHKCER